MDKIVELKAKAWEALRKVEEAQLAFNAVKAELDKAEKDGSAAGN